MDKIKNIKNIKNIKKTVLSTHLILCILIYIYKLKNIINNNQSNISHNSNIHSSKLMNLKKISELGVDLVSNNYSGFLFRILPYSQKILSIINKRNEKSVKTDEKN